MTGSDPWRLYADTRDRFIAAVRPLSPAEADRVVPLTPGWTVAQVLAHVCGLNADVAAGMREGMGTDERTAHQVESRAGRTVEQVCTEWLGHGDAMAAAIAEDGFFGRRLSADLVVHLHDVQHAIGMVIDRADEATISGGRTYASRTPNRLVEAAGVRVEIDLGDGARYRPTGGADTVDLVWRTDPWDALRSITGRRSRAEVAALDWSGDPAPVLDRLCPYGPLRSGDAGL